jgi:AcrR family transcriptional regulator
MVFLVSMKRTRPEIGLVATATALAPSRPRGRSLSRQNVIDLALAITDEEGLPGLTMRKLAERFRVSLATIYSAAGSKEEILAALVDEVLSDLPMEAVKAEFDDIEAIIRLWVAAHELLVAHPAVAQLASIRPVSGRNVFKILELTLTRLRDRGLDDVAAVHAYTLLRAYIIGFTLLRVSRDRPYADDERARIETVRHLPETEFPILRATASLLASQMSHDHFETGLRQLLAGIMETPGPSPAS